MNYLNALDIMSKTIGLLTDGNVNDIQPNPGIEFNRRKSAGEFANLSDLEYASMLAVVNEISEVVWHGQRFISTGEMARRLIVEATQADGQQARLAQSLATGYKAGHPSASRADPYVELPVEVPVRANRADRTGVAPDVFKMTPQQIFDELSRTVWGQDEGKRAVASLIYNHLRNHARHLVLVGPTGSGKTHVIEAARALFPNIVDVDGSQISAEGWKGEVKLSNIFLGLSKYDAEHALVVVDEADKLFEPQFGGSGQNYALLTQNGLLKLMDGGNTKVQLSTEQNAQPTLINTANISFIFLGSFERMLSAREETPNGLGFGADVRSRRHDGYEATFTSRDLEEYAGMRREIAGRIGRIVQMYPLTVDDYLRIIDDPGMSPAYRIEREYGVSLGLTDAEKRELAQSAVDSKLGVRYIARRLEDRVDDMIFEGGCGRAEEATDESELPEAQVEQDIDDEFVDEHRAIGDLDELPPKRRGRQAARPPALASHSTRAGGNLCHLAEYRKHTSNFREHP